MTILIKSPAQCSPAELKEFCDLVASEGEVDVPGLPRLVSAAKMLGFLHLDGKNIGIAGLKQPRQGYRADVFRKAKSTHRPEDFPYELGWVVVGKDYRRKGHSRGLCQRLLEYAEGSNVFATAKSGNEPMHRTLTKCGFAPDGSRYPSKMRKEELLLFVRTAQRAGLQVE
jgi:RimJ/RimL family protein N-acetyltransferase